MRLFLYFTAAYICMVSLIGCVRRIDGSRKSVGLSTDIINGNIERVLCRRMDIDSIYNEPSYNCLHFQLIDEPCLEAEVSEQIRISIIYRSGSAEIIRFTKMPECWIRVKKSIPEGCFGVFAYLVHENDIRYTVHKQIWLKPFGDKIDALMSAFSDQENDENCAIAYILEVRNGTYRRKYSNDQLINISSIETIKSLTE